MRWRRVLVATAVLWAVAAVTSGVILHPYDVAEYEHYARSALHLPLFAHLPQEYPATALALFVAPLVLPLRYPAAFAVEMGAILFVLVLGYGKDEGRAASEEPVLRLLAYLAVGSVMVLTGRYDLAAAAAAYWAVRAAGDGRFRRAWIWCAVGVALKLFPAALWPVLLLAEWRAIGRIPWRRLWWAAAAVLVVVVIPLVADRPALLDTLRYYLHRPVEVGSLAAGLSVVFDWSPSRWSEAAHSLTVANGVVDPLATVVTAIAVVGCVAVWWAQSRGRLTLPSAALATLTLVVLGSKVFSVQYVIWLVPFWALWRMRSSWAAGAAVGTAVFPIAASALLFHYATDRALGTVLTLMYLVRDLLIVAGTVAWVREQWIPEPAPATAA